MWFETKRNAYVRAMLIAIRRACYDASSGVYHSKTDGLRVIKRFERVNNIAFDPFDSSHVDMVAGWGWNEGLLRGLHKVFRKKGE